MKVCSNGKAPISNMMVCSRRKVYEVNIGENISLVFVTFFLLNLNYSMFHVTWITFKFNRNQLRTVSAYVI